MAIALVGVGAAATAGNTVVCSGTDTVTGGTGSWTPSSITNQKTDDDATRHVHLDLGAVLSIGSGITTVKYSNTVSGTLGIALQEYSGVTSFGTALSKNNISTASWTNTATSTTGANSWIVGPFGGNANVSFTPTGVTQFQVSAHIAASSIGVLVADSGNVAAAGTTIQLSITTGSNSSGWFDTMEMKALVGGIQLRMLVGVGLWLNLKIRLRMPLLRLFGRIEKE